MKNTYRIVHIILLCLLCTCGLGVWLRWSLLHSSLLGPFSFSNLKHAHSHLGYFGVLFPILFIAWHQRGSLQLGLWSRYSYLFAVLLCTIGFAQAGYRIDSIAGSTIVGGVWLIAAWRQRSFAFHRTEWMPVVPLGILLACFCIPPIAVFTRRDPAFAQQLVQTFLSSLLFLVAIPSLQERLRIPAPHAGIWLLLGVSSALFMGIYPHPILGWGLVAAGLLLQWKSTQVRLSSRTWLDYSVIGMWWAWSWGAILLGLRILPNQHHIAVAGLHFTILGPLLISAWYIFARSTMRPFLYVSYIFSVCIMSGAIAAQTLYPLPIWKSITALSGTVVWILVPLFGFLYQKEYRMQSTPKS